ADALQSQHSFQKTAQATIEFIPSAIHGLIYCFIIPVMVFFSTRDRDLVKSFLWHVYPDNVPHLRKIAEAVVQQLDYYVRGKVVHMFTLGTISFLLFSSFHLNYAYMLAVPMGFSVFVPLVGGALATIPVFLTGYTQFGFGWTFLHLVIAYELMLLFESNVLEPMIFSHSNQMHPLAILTSVIILGGTIGVWGVFLAIPTAAILKVLGRLWPIYDNGTYEEWVKKCS
ncbi:MAG: AI-2E family transporter, partial [Gammaproteobacteria bacterium]|nr:AI-2E family transporter [Gammaproteobacteria bacterium]